MRVLIIVLCLPALLQVVRAFGDPRLPHVTATARTLPFSDARPDAVR